METEKVIKMSSPKWKRPEEVMKFHRLKHKRRALSARINGNDNVTNLNFSYSSSSGDGFEYVTGKRKNPFSKRLCESNTKFPDVTYESGVETDVSSDSTVFQVLGNSAMSSTSKEAPKSFANILQHLHKNEINDAQVKPEENQSPKKINHKDGLHIPIDWSIKNKIRLMSSTPFVWSANLRTCEQASSITGFVRCLDNDRVKEQNARCTLDTSPNARFHQCCLYWQHPNIPWLQLFPRNPNKSNASMISAQLQMAPNLLTEWTTSFKSLFQLVRTRQCPFFYMIANHFCCLFQAAGMAGIYEPHALINPTTRGFRKLLEDEGVKYSMPLKRKRKSNEFASDSEGSQLTTDNEDLDSGDEDDDDEDDDDDGDEDDWMDSIGIDTEEIKKMTASQKTIKRAREGNIDESNESLVMIEGVNLQAFFNVLLNYKGCISNTGPYAGIPPTLISPTSFSLATLKSCRVRDSVVHVNGADFYSIHIDGPVLPHSFRKICILLEEYKTQYSASLTTAKQSLGFALALKNIDVNKENKSFSSVFLRENLSDCGLSQKVITIFCEDDREKYGVIEKIEPKTNV